MLIKSTSGALRRLKVSEIDLKSEGKPIPSRSPCVIPNKNVFLQSGGFQYA